jgi:hypothetical protein
MLRCFGDPPWPIYKHPTRACVVHAPTLLLLLQDVWTFCVLGPSWATVIKSRSGVGKCRVDCLSIPLSNPAHKYSNMALLAYIAWEWRQSRPFSTVSNPDWTISAFTCIGRSCASPSNEFSTIAWGEDGAKICQPSHTFLMYLTWQD